MGKNRKDFIDETSSSDDSSNSFDDESEGLCDEEQKKSIKSGALTTSFSTLKPEKKTSTGVERIDSSSSTKKRKKISIIDSELEGSSISSENFMKTSPPKKKKVEASPQEKTIAPDVQKASALSSLAPPHDADEVVDFSKGPDITTEKAAKS